MIFPMLAVVSLGNPLVHFVIVGVLVALALYFLPRWIPMDSQVWQIIRVVVIIALVLWALALFGII